MIGHLVRIGVITFLALVGMILPYLPGQYDGFAGTLSVMAQLFGVIGLLQVPIGILWWIHGLRKRSAGAQELRDRRGYHSVYDGPRPHWRYFWFD